MKAMKKALVNTCCVLGILSLGLLAGCADIISGPPSVSPETSANMGRAVVSIGPQLEGARTFMPTAGGGYYEGLSYAYTFAAVGKNPVSGPITGGTGSVELEVGTWDLRVTGKAGNTEVLEGTAMGVVITAEATKTVQVTMAAFTESGTGTLSYSVDLPAGIIKGTLTIYHWDGETAQRTVDLPTITATTETGNITALSAGYYRIALDLYKADGVFHSADIAHIYPGLATAVGYIVVDGDFIGADVGNETSLAAVLGGIGALPSDQVYLLSAVAESMSAAAAVSNTNPVTVTIDGGGRTVTLNNTGSLITVGNNVTLILMNITLQGRGLGVDNNAALVSVQSGGTLELGTGAKITANKTSSSSSGGGVYVGSGGIFIMNGGEISGNTMSAVSSSWGGGVYVHSGGTFIMRGGKILDNTASSSGGGVYVYGGNFDMSGGEISDNRAASLSSYSFGGGVFVNSGTFAMSGGKISGNMAYPSGGGVYVFGGSFDMSGGEISDNTASSSSSYNSEGGGVYVHSSGTFNMGGGKISDNRVSSTSSSFSFGGGVSIYGGIFDMSGGEISDNTASSTFSPYNSFGGGVSLSENGAFTMSGGEISGNRVSSSSPSSFGGGVYVSTGAFTMSGGEISGNTASSSSSPYGGGVYLCRGGTFIMSDEARVNVNNALCLEYSGASSYSSVTIGGDFTGPDGPVAKIDLNGGDGNWLGKTVLKLSYSGNLAVLKRRFILGSFSVSLPITGYVIDDDGILQAPSIGITNVSHSAVSGSAVWPPLIDGRRQSPAIGDSSVTKSRVSFTATQANASIVIWLDVSSESGCDYAFISELDNAGATYDNGFYSGSRISGTISAPITIPIPTTGSHFVDIGYRKDGSVNTGSDCAWYKVIIVE
jgi:hypothetical protein